MANDQGGPAFPSTEFAAPGFTYQDGATHRTEEGMSLRDWFAGKALAGMLARPDFNLFTSDGDEMMAALAASNAYEIADAMIAESRK